LKVENIVLTEVVRQALESGILFNASNLRDLINENNTSAFPSFTTKDFKDITYLNGSEFIDQIQLSYKRAGEEDTIIVTRSNKRANLYNNGIRNRVLYREEELSNGDLLMVTKNNYFWNKPHKEIDFIANGDILEIVRIRKHREMYGFRFVDLTLRSLDYEWEIDARIWIDILQSDSPIQANEMHQKLFEAVAEDYPEIKNRRMLVKQIYENEFFNALQVKFAYAVTCHKAQGGQWKDVYVDPGQISDEQINTDFYRWMYTAITRATENVYLVNFPDKNP